MVFERIEKCSMAKKAWRHQMDEVIAKTADIEIKKSLLAQMIQNLDWDLWRCHDPENQDTQKTEEDVSKPIDPMN